MAFHHLRSNLQVPSLGLFHSTCLLPNRFSAYSFHQTPCSSPDIAGRPSSLHLSSCSCLHLSCTSPAFLLLLQGSHLQEVFPDLQAGKVTSFVIPHPHVPWCQSTYAVTISFFPPSSPSLLPDPQTFPTAIHMHARAPTPQHTQTRTHARTHTHMRAHTHACKPVNYLRTVTHLIRFLGPSEVSMWPRGAGMTGRCRPSCGGCHLVITQEGFTAAHGQPLRAGVTFKESWCTQGGRGCSLPLPQGDSGLVSGPGITGTLAFRSCFSWTSVERFLSPSFAPWDPLPA